MSSEVPCCPSAAGAAGAGAPTGADCELVLRLPPVTDVSLSPCGHEAALATRHGAVVASLDQRAEPHHVRSWRAASPPLDPAVSRLAFSPHGGRRRLAAASGRSVYVVDIADADAAGHRHAERHNAGHGGSGTVKAVFSNHLRPVNALDWSPHNPEIFATCGEDCRFFIWDVRQAQPGQSLLLPASWTTAVRWSVLDDNQLATGHEDTVCIWDLRSPSRHMRVLAPGQSRILGIDWSIHERGKVLTVSAKSNVCSGDIKVWDISSAERVFESIDIENGIPGAARFLPFGPAVLAAVDKSLVVFSLQRGAGRRAKILHNFVGHSAPISALDFVPHPAHEGGAGKWGDLRLISFSAAERCLRAWRYSAPEDLWATVTSRLPGPGWATSPGAGPGSTPSASPVLGPSDTASPPGLRSLLPPALGGGGDGAQDEEILGALAKQQQILRQLHGVKEVTSYRQATEYQLLIEVCTANDIELRITVRIDPTATGRRAGALGGPAQGAAGRGGSGLRTEVDWADEWAGTFDGPLSSGVIEETFRTLSLEDIFKANSTLCELVSALVRMLDRGDSPPQLDGLAPTAAAAAASAAGAPVGPGRHAQASAAAAGGRGAAAPRKGEPGFGHLPFPRTCGVCWSPQGDLLRFRSLQNFVPPFPTRSRRWSMADYRRVMKMYHQREERELLPHGDDEHAAAVREMKIDKSVQFTPRHVLNGLVEDHWWTAAAPKFCFEPAISSGALGGASAAAAATCLQNGETAMSVGRADLAEVWRIAASLCEGTAGALRGVCARPFASRLVQQIFRQLFEAQETLTIAMLGSVLLCVGSGGGGGDASRCPPGGGGAGGGAAAGVGRCHAGHGPRRRRRPLRGGAPHMRQTLGEMGSSFVVFTERSVFDRGSSATWHAHALDASELARAARGFGIANALQPPWLVAAPSSAVSHLSHISQSADNTISSCLSASASPVGGEPVTPVAVAARPSVGTSSPTVVRMAPSGEDDIGELVPRDEQTMERLLHSCHAHCDIMHRLGEFRASRALAKVMHKLRAHHELPLLGAGEALFGARQCSPPGVRLPELAVGTPAPWPPLEATAAPRCAVCCLDVRTLYTPCWGCGHGYHMRCFREWFESPGLGRSVCPAVGCECRCLQQRPQP